MGVERRAGESAAARYRPRRPSESVLYRCFQQHLETWLVVDTGFLGGVEGGNFCAGAGVLEEALPHRL